MMAPADKMLWFIRTSEGLERCFLRSHTYLMSSGMFHATPRARPRRGELQSRGGHCRRGSVLTQRHGGWGRCVAGLAHARFPPLSIPAPGGAADWNRVLAIRDSAESGDPGARRPSSFILDCGRSTLPSLSFGSRRPPRLSRVCRTALTPSNTIPWFDRGTARTMTLMPLIFSPLQPCPGEASATQATTSRACTRVHPSLASPTSFGLTDRAGGRELRPPDPAGSKTVGCAKRVALLPMCYLRPVSGEPLIR